MNTPGPGLRGMWFAVEQALRIELMDGTADVVGVWQDLAREHGLELKDESGGVLKALAAGAKRLGRYRLLPQGLPFGIDSATYELWRGNVAAQIQPFTPEHLEQYKRDILHRDCPMWRCEEFDLVQREVPEHVTYAQYADELGLTVDAFARSALGTILGLNRPAPTGHSLEDIVDYVSRAVGEPERTSMTATEMARQRADMLQRVSRLAERCREPDGRPDRVTIAAEIAAWMHHPQAHVFAANGARHREASRRRWDERMRAETAPHPELVFRR